MELTRTANAGVLLKLDGVSILLDGVCGRVAPYCQTPETLQKWLCEDFPDVVAYTHEHGDHFHKEFADFYQKVTLRPILGPETLPVSTVLDGHYQIGTVRIDSIRSRHIGKAAFHTQHRSFVIQGTRTVWFLGDASPLQFRQVSGFLRPCVLMVPFTYVTNTTGWDVVKQLNPETVIVLHLPPQEDDLYGLWEMTKSITAEKNSFRLFIPAMGETIRL